MRIVTWNVARRRSRLGEQAAALANREPDLVALQEVSDRTLPLWRAALETIGMAHVRASLEGADPARVPAARRSTGVLLGSRATPDAVCGTSVDRSGTRPSSASSQGYESSATATRSERCTATRTGSRAGPGGALPVTTAVGVSITSSHRRSLTPFRPSITTH